MNEQAPIDYHRLFAESAALTISVETVVLFVVVRLWFKLPQARLSNWLLLFAGVFASAGTLPWLWFVGPRLIESYIIFIIVGELLVWAAEGLFYRVVLDLGWGRSALLSLACNLVSFGAGWLRR